MLLLAGAAAWALPIPPAGAVKVPILMYHSVTDDPAKAGKYTVTAAEFEADMEVWDGDVPLPAEFRYADYQIFEGTARLQSGLPQAGGGLQTLAVTLRDGALPLTLTLYYTDFGGVLTRRAVLKNESRRTLTVRKLMHIVRTPESVSINGT